MANTVTSTPNDLTLSAGFNTTKSGKISWTAPTLPDGAIVKSCVLTGKATASSTNVTSIKINDQSITVSTSGYNFTIDLGKDNSITSVTATMTKSGWSTYNVKFTNMTYTVTYELASVSYTVTFKDWDGSVLKTQTVASGGSATPPPNPTRDGYTFSGWSGNYTNVTADVDIIAQYTQNSSGGGDEPVKSNTLLVDWDTYEVYAGRFWQGKLEGHGDCYDASKTDNGLKVYLGSVNIQGVVLMGIKGDGPGIYTIECDCIIPSNKTYTPDFFANANTFSSDGTFIQQANNNIIMSISNNRYYMEFELTSDFDYLWLDVGVYNGTKDEYGGYYEFANLNFYKGNFYNRGKFVIGSGGDTEDTSVKNIKIGNSTISKLYLGTSQIVKVYLGDTLIYSNLTGGN